MTTTPPPAVDAGKLEQFVFRAVDEVGSDDHAGSIATARAPGRPRPAPATGSASIVEPAAGDRVEDNLNPVGRADYGFSTLLCTPSSLDQGVGATLGAQAGEARIREVVAAGGLTRLRRVAETPFNLVFEARREASAGA